jgi:hypothetical protein
VPGRHQQGHARTEEQREDEPEADARATGAPPVLDARLPPRALQPHRLAHGVMVDERYVGRFVVGLEVSCLLGHPVKCMTGTLVASILHTMQPMAYPNRDVRGDSLLERGILGIGERLELLAGVVLAVSAFTGWYSGPGEGVKVSIIGWNTGYAGKLVFFLGLAAVIVVVLREVGVTLPAAFPESLVTIGLGAAATILVLVRVFSIPDDFFFAGRGIGIWISLVAAIGVIIAGLLEASEEL